MEVNCTKTFRSVEGKTVTVEALVEDGRVKDVKVTGDFFVTDDRAFEEFENSLRDKDCEGLKSLRVTHAMLGASEEEVILAVLQCLPCSG